MLRSRHFLVAFDADGWHVARATGRAVEVCDVRAEASPSPPPPSPQGREAPSPSPLPWGEGGGVRVPAQAIAAQLRSWGYRGRGVCLGLPSDLVLAADVDAANLPRRSRRSALLYRLEEQLPVDAEALTADFLPQVNGRVLGVAAITGRVREAVEPLAEAGVEVAAVCPTALLALWAALRQRPPRAHHALVAAGGHVGLFRLADNNQPVAWATLRQDPAELLLGFQADLLTRPVDAPPAQALVVGPLDPQAAGAPRMGRLGTRAASLHARAGPERRSAPKALIPRHPEPKTGVAPCGGGRTLRGSAGPFRTLLAPPLVSLYGARPPRSAYHSADGGSSASLTGMGAPSIMRRPSGSSSHHRLATRKGGESRG
ncbi:MAG: hypothetical protein FJ291_15290 [Planctomycetes bacterium]|nr:hypothetical protein [Planctomycetota bacterium]